LFVEISIVAVMTEPVNLPPSSAIAATSASHPLRIRPGLIASAYAGNASCANAGRIKPALRLVRAALIAVAGASGILLYSLFGSVHSLFREKDSRFRKEQGNSPRLFESLRDFASAGAKTVPNRPSLAKFPVLFPVFREFR
jgi:hypothetical protein